MKIDKLIKDFEKNYKKGKVLEARKIYNELKQEYDKLPLDDKPLYNKRISDIIQMEPELDTKSKKLSKKFIISATVILFIVAVAIAVLLISMKSPSQDNSQEFSSDFAIPLMNFKDNVDFENVSVYVDAKLEKTLKGYRITADITNVSEQEALELVGMAEEYL